MGYGVLDAYCLIGLAEALPTSARCIHSLEVCSAASGQLIARKCSANGANEPPDEGADIEALDAQIVSKGAEVRSLKSAGASKAAIQAEVGVLLQLKASFQKITGVAWAPPPPTAEQSRNTNESCESRPSDGLTSFIPPLRT